MTTYIWANIGGGNGLLSDPMLIDISVCGVWGWGRGVGGVALGFGGSGRGGGGK